MSSVPPSPPGTPWVNRLCIVGVGLIGGSIGLAAKARGAAKHVVGVEKNSETWAHALRVGAVDEITNDLVAGVRDADLVILAVPVEVILELLPRLAPLLKPHTVVMDVGSVKKAVVRAGKNASPLAFIGSHPMAGGERGGVQNARADLFEGATWAVVPPINYIGDDIEYVSDFVTALGAKPLVMFDSAHDEAVALTSHLPHVLAYTLSAMRANHSAGRQKHLLALSAGSWKSATRVAESPPELWTQIAVQNAPSLAALLRAFADELVTIATALETGDSATVQERFAAGHAAKLGEIEKQP
ncbi:MAG: prephenate dehydrogenase/arogenate dehydrogenase family protein [Fibrella sp.]|nr:prephenate dehydrogenase/arogenate dehydrogenase family protein [Armatimonadota bacterium]